MKKITALMMALVITFLGASSALAAPFKAADKNPQVVAYYESGPHGIVGESAYHEGKDLVMKTGKSGNFQQWFYGTSEELPNLTEGDHSVWKDVGSSTTCPNDKWVLVENAYPAWGDYLNPGANYCVHTNDFHSSIKH